MLDRPKQGVLEFRRHSGYLFLAVIVGHIVLISAQVPANSRSQVPMLETVTFGVFSEIQRAVSSVVGGVRNFWSEYVALRGVRGENESLKRQLVDLQVQLQQQRALAVRSRQLEELLKLRDQAQLPTLAALVVAAGATPEFRTITIDKGSTDGLRKDMAVISPAGVIGRVAIPSARAAKVQLLIDRNAAAGALIERSRAQGVVTGTGELTTLQMEFVPEAADVQAGDLVVTSGIDGIYPKGFVIGKIESVGRGAGIYTKITVRPAVDFTSMEEVLVVIAPPVPTAPEGTK
jgi:rod shape-determining protein MreC